MVSPGLAEGAAAARRRGAERCPGGAPAALRGGSRAAELRPGGSHSYRCKHESKVREVMHT